MLYCACYAYDHNGTWAVYQSVANGSSVCSGISENPSFVKVLTTTEHSSENLMGLTNRSYKVL